MLEGKRNVVNASVNAKGERKAEVFYIEGRKALANLMPVSSYYLNVRNLLYYQWQVYGYLLGQKVGL